MNSSDIATSSTNKGWDAIDVDALLPLVGVRTMSTEFGFLFRPYWMPDTTLQYEETIRQRFPGGETVGFRRVGTKEMCRCTADSLFWRERTLESDREENGLVRFTPFRPDEHLCEYDSSVQTFRMSDPATSDVWPTGENAAADLTLLRQPLLTPLVPIPLGFRWHVRSKSGRLDFVLESKQTVGDMTVLFVRRRGQLFLNEFYRLGNAHPQRYALERTGLTAYALERSVILEDRVRDVVRSAGPPTTLENLETVTIQKLTKSSWKNEGKTAPLYLKYQTKKDVRSVANNKEHDFFHGEIGDRRERVDSPSGSSYKSPSRWVYDCGTGRILEVDPVIHAILDDVGMLSKDELLRKHEPLETAKVETALREIGQLQEQGHLVGHAPAELNRIDRATIHGKTEDIETFCRTKGTLLVLGLTERCNLRCEYCCYSGKFDGLRKHSSKTMSLEIARKAISAFLENDLVEGERHAISFYGGEPLLEFHLLRECVRFAVEYARSAGREVRFAVTTNGTLLDDATVDYLVEHEFLVMVSLDGPKESHDRYRIFPGGKGSFDIVAENLRRFAKRYPDHINRGLSITLAPPLRLEETKAFIEEFYADYPFTRTSLVNTGSEHRFDDDATSPMQYGCSSKDACQKNMPTEAFRSFSEQDRRQLKKLWKAYVGNLARHEAAETWKRMPFAMSLFQAQMDFYHRRPVTKTTPNRLFYIPCVPGVTRRFCDASGNYRICERVDDSAAYIIGDVQRGLDAKKIERTMEFRRHLGDCGNCTTLKTCDICYAKIPDSDAVNDGFDPRFEKRCRQTRSTTLQMLRAYTGIMERNPKAFEHPSDADVSRMKKPRYGTSEPDMTPETAERIKYEIF